MESLLLTNRMDTVPIIHVGDYTYRQDIFDNICITNREGDERWYSIYALQTIARSTGMPSVMRVMAQDALDWVEEKKKSESAPE